MDSLSTLQELQQFNNLDLLARQVVEGFITGLHKSPFHGFSVEFAEHRLYNSGDSVRNIDWKLFARSDKLFSKRYEEETNLRCQLVIDTSSSMYYPDEKLNKIRFSVLASAALVYLFRKQRDAFGLSLMSDELNFTSKASATMAHQKLIFNELEKILLEPKQRSTSSLSKSLHLIAEQIHKRSLVIIFSDMLDSDGEEDLMSSLQHLKHNKHEVVLFHTTDKKMEMDFDFDNRPYIFVDRESGAELKLRANEIREHYVQSMNEYVTKLKTKCHQYKVDFVEADINKGFEQILSAYLLKRTRMI